MVRCYYDNINKTKAFFKQHYPGINPFKIIRDINLDIISRKLKLEFHLILATQPECYYFI